MSRSTWNQPIDKHTDWNGDSSTSNLPVSGARVQDFIKDTFEGKAGFFYYDSTNNRYLVFADEENKDLYLSDPVTYRGLVLSTFGSSMQSSATITLVETQTFNYIDISQKGVYIKAYFETKDMNGQTTGEPVTATINIRAGNKQVEVTRQCAYGVLFQFKMDDYLSEGTNTVTLTIKGMNTLATTANTIMYYVMHVSLTDTFDISSTLHDGAANDSLAIPFVVKGNGTKHMEWYIDGVAQTAENTDTITQTEYSRTKYISISGLAPGRHNLQYRAYVFTSDEQRFYSDTLYRDFVITGGTSLVILVGFHSPASGGIISTSGQSIPLYGLEMYKAKPIQYAIYDPYNSASNEVTISFDGKQSIYAATNNTVYDRDLKPYHSGTLPLVLTCGSASLAFSSTVSETTLNLQQISDTEFEFDGTAKTNASGDRAVYINNGHTMSLSGFAWNESSGWIGDGLLINNGAIASVNYAPLASGVMTNGVTVEIEFETRRVMDDNATICNLRTGTTGILITASEASLTSRGGVSVSTKYKSGELTRVSFIVNRLTGVTNKGLVFICVNGILSGAVPYLQGDSFQTSTLLSFAGSEDASILLRQIRIYNRALSLREIENNYILYRPTVEEMIDAYDYNDVFEPNSETLSLDKLSSQTPIIIVTGDLEALQNASDKNMEVTMEKIEVINMDDPTKSMTLTDAIMRPQGTTSMTYPKKNFRFYSKRGANTKMYDSSGEEVQDRLYAFKDGSQRVAVWCLKADYAESSSTHNTGVARLWNEALKGFRIDNIDSRYYRYGNTIFPGRTIAQQAALDNSYGYDVRTTVDGFPIVLFYHRHESDPLIFLGKYNWNNDKSTPSVFGFSGITGFDNSHMECWEMLDSEREISNFISVAHWDDPTTDTQGNTKKNWLRSFEARYPDDSGKPSEEARGDNALKTVVAWVASTNGASVLSGGELVVGNASLMNKFSTEKWQHFDVYKLAAYYIYLMRFGAVDQVAKNAMFTTEDGVHWFFINYDNDTIFGVRNDGLLKFGYDIDRQSKDPDDVNSYCYAAHSSVLWNNLEADEDFMAIVKAVDSALYKSGLTYSNVIEMFNEEQSAKWSERIHNLDYQFKYLDVWNDTNNNQLEKLQGARTTHREWWISHRFAKYDAINFCGGYTNNYIQVKTLSSGDRYLTVVVTPSSTGQIYGYGVAARSAEETGIVGTKDVPITFTTPYSHQASVGSPLNYYNAAYIKKFDASQMITNINEVFFDSINTDAEDSALEWVVLGSQNQNNTACTQLGSISYAKLLKKLDIRNFKSLASLDLSHNIYIEELDARGSALANVTLPAGAPTTTLQFPQALQTLILKNLTSLETLTIEGFNSTNNVNTIDVQGCPQLPICTSFAWLRQWKNGRGQDPPAADLTIDNINWTFTDETELLQFVNYVTEGGGQYLFRGIATLQSIDEEGANNLMEEFGANVFRPTSAFRIVALSGGIYITGPDEVLSGKTAQYAFANMTGAEGNVVFQLTTGASGVSIDRTTGLLTTTENTSSNNTVTITASMVLPGEVYRATKDVLVKRVIYPANATINGDDRITGVSTYTWSTTTLYVNGEYTATWELTGDITSLVTATTALDGSSITLDLGNNTGFLVEGTLTLTLRKASNNVTLATATKSVIVQDDTIAFSSTTHPVLMSVMYNNGFSSSPDYMLKTECSILTSTDIAGKFSQNRIGSNEDMSVFQYFTSVTYIPEQCFYQNSFRKIILPASVTAIKYRGLYISGGLTSIQHIGNGSITVSDDGINLQVGTSTQIDFPMEFDQTTSHGGTSSTNYDKVRMHSDGNGNVYFNGELSTVGYVGRCLYLTGDSNSAHIRSLVNFNGGTSTYKSLVLSNVYVDSITTSSHLFSEGHVYLGEDIHEIGDWFLQATYSNSRCTCSGSISTIAQQTSLRYWKLELLNNSTLPTTINLTADRVDDGSIIVKHSLLGAYRTAWPDLYYKFGDGFVAQGDAIEWRVYAEDCRKNNTTTKLHIEKKYNGTYADGTTGQEWLEDSVVTSSSFEVNNTNAPITRTLSYTLNGVTKSYSFTHSNKEYIAVDLELPSGLKWADTNLGAAFPDEGGLYYAWGETTGYIDADARNAALGTSEGFDLTNYSGKSIRANLSSSNDAAYAATNGEYRMPTKEEYEELFANTYYNYTTNASGTMSIIKLTSKADRTKTLTLAIPGYYFGNNKRTSAYLWSSSYRTYSYRYISGVANYYPIAYCSNSLNSVGETTWVDGDSGLNIRGVQ